VVPKKGKKNQRATKGVRGTVTSGGGGCDREGSKEPPVKGEEKG